MRPVAPPTIALLAFAGMAFGGIDSGGGKSIVGSEVLWSSIGSPFGTTPVAVGDHFIFPGQIEVIYSRANPTDADIDGNGIPDFWARYYFGTLRIDALADNDGDGTSNLMEFLAGTSPRSPMSSYRIQSNYGDGAFTLDFPTMTGRSYRVWWSADLKASWILHETHQGNGHLGRSSFSPAIHDPLNASRGVQRKYFFRVEILKP
jgi:hypothetical protein